MADVPILVTRIPWLVLIGLLLAPFVPARGEETGEDAAGRARREMEVLAAVPAAVARGVRYVAACQRAGGAFDGFGEEGPDARFGRLHRFGKTALATLTLLHGGRSGEDPVVAEGLRFLRRRWRETMSGHGLRAGATYSLSLFAMALHRLGEQGVATGSAPGRISATNPLGLEGWARDAVRSVHRWLLRTRNSDGLYAYPLGGVGPSDLSNTQYALLGLWAGTRCGEQVASGTLAALADALLAAQASKGRHARRWRDEDVRGPEGERTTRDRARGFAYRSLASGIRYPVTGAMTAGGLSSLLIVKALLDEQGDLDGERAARLDRGIWDALAWLTVRYDVSRNPVGDGGEHLPEAVRKQFEAGGDVIDQAGWHAYYLYALERALVIGGKRYLGTSDWYVEGAELLLASQDPGGGWSRGARRDVGGQGAASYPDPLVDACFSLLFLQRATLRPRSPLLAR